MKYRTFVTYNIVGGLLWGVGVTTLGYFLGEIEFVKNNLEIAAVDHRRHLGAAGRDRVPPASARDGRSLVTRLTPRPRNRGDAGHVEPPWHT